VNKALRRLLAGGAVASAASLLPLLGLVTLLGVFSVGATSAKQSPTSCSGTCTSQSSSLLGEKIVHWARAMADALYADPSCQSGCRDTSYTSAFPSEVIAYGQSWCAAHGDCSDWANGSYQCVSFVRGAYSQVYPMKLTNDAYGLWATYQGQPGWQEIPAAATTDPAQRSLPAPGDVLVFKSSGVGHAAIVIAVQAPLGQTPGWVEFANANSSSPYDRMPLLPSLLVDTSAWAASGGNYVVWGYIRPKPQAAQALVRISQLDPAQYADTQEDHTWAYSACSAAAMTEVLDAYGKQLRIHDVLTVEASLGEITPSGGLQEDAGIARTLQPFGFQTDWGEHWTLQQLLATANGGQPVIVGWPPDRYEGGHLLVVTGGDLASGTIELADSSAYNRHRLSVAQFQQWWAGFAAVATPL
jgi:hypothetical protein